MGTRATNQDGFTLLSVMIALGITGVMAAYSMSAVDGFSRGAGQVRLITEKKELGDRIMRMTKTPAAQPGAIQLKARINCQVTRDQARQACANLAVGGLTYVDVWGPQQSGPGHRRLIPKTGRRLGEYTLALACTKRATPYPNPTYPFTFEWHTVVKAKGLGPDVDNTFADRNADNYASLPTDRKIRLGPKHRDRRLYDGSTIPDSFVPCNEHLAAHQPAPNNSNQPVVPSPKTKDAIDTKRTENVDGEFLYVRGKRCLGYKNGQGPSTPHKHLSECKLSQAGRANCPSGYRKIISIPDRFGDFGADVAWVTICQVN